MYGSKYFSAYVGKTCKKKKPWCGQISKNSIIVEFDFLTKQKMSPVLVQKKPEMDIMRSS